MSWTSREDLFELLGRTLPQLRAYRAVVSRTSGRGNLDEQAKLKGMLSDLDLLIGDIEQLSIPSPTGRPAGKHTPWANKDRYSSDH